MLGKPHRGGVDRAGEGVDHRHLARVFALEIARLPAVDLDRLGRQPVLRHDAFLECCEVDEQLERRAGLALRLGDAVELALGIGAAALHRADPAVETHRHQGRLVGLPALALLRQDVLDRRLGGALQGLIEGGVDHEAGLRRLGVQAAVGHHPVGEVAGGAQARPGEAGGLGLGLCRLLGAQHAIAQHAVDDHARRALVLAAGRGSARSARAPGSAPRSSPIRRASRHSPACRNTAARRRRRHRRRCRDRGG